MKFTIQTEKLLKAIDTVLKAVPSRTTIPILTGIKLTLDSEGLTLISSDSNLSIETLISKETIVELKKEGQVVLPGKYFAEIIKKLPQDEVTIFVNSKLETSIKSGRSNFNLNGLDADEYPKLAQITSSKIFKLKSSQLKKLIKQTVFAVSESETRPILTGVNWKIEGTTLTAIATDSHRLSRKSLSIESENPEEINGKSIVIPGKTLTEINKVISDNDEMVEIIFADNQVLFKTAGTTFYSRLLEGNYPDTTRLIPTDFKTKANVSRGELFNGIDRASLLAKEGKHNVVRWQTKEDGNIEISSNFPEIGKVVEDVPIQSLEGDKLRISFSSKYMMEALKTIEGNDIDVNFTGEMRPFIITDQKDESILQLILPVRTY